MFRWGDDRPDDGDLPSRTFAVAYLDHVVDRRPSGRPGHACRLPGACRSAAPHARGGHQRDRVSYLFSGSEQSLLTSIFGERTAPLFGQAEQFRLGPLPAPELGAFIEAKFRATDRRIGPALPSLLALAAGHPQRAAYLAHHVWGQTAPRQTAGEEAWAAALDRALRQSEAEFQATDDGLEPGQRKAVRLLAWGEPLYGAAARRLGLPKGTAQGALRALTRSGMIWLREGSQPSLADPLYAEWLRHRHTPP